MSELAALELSQIEVTEDSPKKQAFVPQTRAAHMTIALEGEIGTVRATVERDRRHVS